MTAYVPGSKDSCGEAASQPRYTVAPANDTHERIADTAAIEVLQIKPPQLVQRKCAACEKEEALHRKETPPGIQRKPEGGSSVATDTVSNGINATRGSGTDLPSATRTFMESRFGKSFSDVRIHTGDYAASLSSELNAQAFTVGKDIYFNEGKFAPDTSQGRFLLAHELTHTIQQSDGLMPKLIQRMLPCPGHLNASDPVPRGWKPYYGPSWVFHCGYRGILEDRRPSPSDPMNECFYDEHGTLVDEHHPNAGCRGTPDYYDSQTQGWDHFWRDPGGIVQAGGPAFIESMGHLLNQHFESEGQRVMECHRICQTQPWYLRGFCLQGCNPMPGP